MTEAGLRADVCVVGGGPAGATTAWLLARRGADVILIDRARFPRDKPCAEYLSPEASRVLAEMGVLERLENSGAARLSGMRVHAPDGRFMHGEFEAAHGFHGFRDYGLGIRRIVLDSVLLEKARSTGVRVLESTRAMELRRDHCGRVHGVHAVTAGPDPAERLILARQVVGADGLRSIVARRMGVARRARWPSRIALVAHYARVSQTIASGEMHVAPGGYLGIAPVGDLVNVALVVPGRTGGKPAITGAPAQYLENWIASHETLAGRFASAERVTPVRAIGPFASRVRRAWTPGAAVVGDAADFFDPFTGEGIYAALRGAELLAPLVAECLADPAREHEAMRQYDRARRREFAGKWLLEWMVAVAVASPAVMNSIVAVLARRKDLADLLVGVCGDFVPPRELLRARFLVPAVAGALSRAPA